MAARLSIASRSLLGPLVRPPVRPPVRTNPDQPLSSTQVSVPTATPTGDRTKKSFVSAISSRVFTTKALCVLGIGGGTVVIASSFAALTAKVGTVAASKVIALHTVAFLQPGVAITAFALKTTGTLTASAVLPIVLPILSTVVVGAGIAAAVYYGGKKLGTGMIYLAKQVPVLSTVVKVAESLTGSGSSESDSSMPAIDTSKMGAALLAPLGIVMPGAAGILPILGGAFSAMTSDSSEKELTIEEMREQHPTFGMTDDEIVAYGIQEQALAREERQRFLAAPAPVIPSLIEPKVKSRDGLVVRTSKPRKKPLKEQIAAERQMLSQRKAPTQGPFASRYNFSKRDE